jgi:ATPase, YjeE family
MKKLIYNSSNLKDTQTLAKKLAACLHKGDIIFFSGPIGAGKTIMVKEIAKFLGVKEKITSASFSLMKKYFGTKADLYHIDLFRLEEGEMFNLGFEEMLEDEASLILAEWPGAAKDFFPKNRLEIEIVLQKGDKRKIILQASTLSYQKLLDNLAKKLNKKVSL